MLFLTQVQTLCMEFWRCNPPIPMKWTLDSWFQWRGPLWLFDLALTHGYNGDWPSARLYGWSVADCWSQRATKNKRKLLVSCWRKLWVTTVDLLRQIISRVRLLKSPQKKCEQKGEIHPQLANSMVLAKYKSVHTLSWTSSSSPGHWSRMRELPFKVR
jgi:hypothetical protein